MVTIIFNLVSKGYMYDITPLFSLLPTQLVVKTIKGQDIGTRTVPVLGKEECT